jgi:hypothetical protein
MTEGGVFCLSFAYQYGKLCQIWDKLHVKCNKEIVFYLPESHFDNIAREHVKIVCQPTSRSQMLGRPAIYIRVKQMNIKWWLGLCK